MIRLEFYDPGGALENAQPHAARLQSLEGKRIGIVSNDHWQAPRMLPMIKAWLEEDVPGIEVLPLNAFPHGSALIDTDQTATLIKNSGVDAVILGNAA